MCLAVLAVPVAAAADDPLVNTRLHLHGTKQLGQTLGISGWVTAPNPTSAPDLWLGVTGPKFSGESWWVEVMGGAIVQQGGHARLLDTRASLSLPYDLSLWGNVEWIDPGGGDVLYTYLEADLALKDGGVLFGLETENSVSSSAEDLSAGPHVILPFSRGAFIVAYQVHGEGPGQVWLRALVEL